MQQALRQKRGTPSTKAAITSKASQNDGRNAGTPGLSMTLA